MKQYHKHLEAILENGTKKDPARGGMPRSISLFGYQNRYNLQEGFPILTTKKVNFKNIVTELLWFLRGDTNIKYLVDNGCNIWNEDAYNYYNKLCKIQGILRRLSFEEFYSKIKNNDLTSTDYINDWKNPKNYKLGDCGKQYGWLWRSLEGGVDWVCGYGSGDFEYKVIDQIKNLIEGLKNNPMSRRQIVTAWNPATLDDMALNACHAFVQFNCRKLNHSERIDILNTTKEYDEFATANLSIKGWEIFMDELNIPNYKLDCQLYQRSADMFLGVPYNISSYALLTEIIAKICNMIPGDFIHTFGDSHIYDNHLEQVKEILTRDTKKYLLPKLRIKDELDFQAPSFGFDRLLPEDFELENYQSYPSIKAKLSTGLK